MWLSQYETDCWLEEAPFCETIVCQWVSCQWFPACLSARTVPELVVLASGIHLHNTHVCKLCYMQHNFLATSGVFFLTVTIGYCPKFYESHMYSLKLGTTNLPPVFGILSLLQS